jgi:hypothetical protein
VVVAAFSSEILGKTPGFAGKTPSMLPSGTAAQSAFTFLSSFQSFRHSSQPQMSDSTPPSNQRAGAYRLVFLVAFIDYISNNDDISSRSLFSLLRFMFLTSLVMMTQWAIFSLPSSFFPAAARSISISDSQMGIIFGAFPLGTMVGAAAATPAALRCGPTRLVNRCDCPLHFYRICFAAMFPASFPSNVLFCSQMCCFVPGAPVHCSSSPDVGVICHGAIRSVRHCCGIPPLLHPLPERCRVCLGRVHYDDHRLQLPPRQSGSYYGLSRSGHRPWCHGRSHHRQLAPHSRRVAALGARARQHAVRAVLGHCRDRGVLQHIEQSRAFTTLLPFFI